jgi:uncharacterized membrane protein YphA (DoxX/SURF4 family)
VPSPFTFWPCVAGLVFLILGLVAVRKDLASAIGLDKLIALGFVFYAAPLAVFSAEHLAGARLLMPIVPPYMPGRLFWTYFVGLALLAAAFSLVLEKYLRWSAPLLAAMFFLFVLMIHIPGAIAHPKDRLFWTLVLRETSFAAGALALTGFVIQNRHSGTLISLARLCIAIPLIAFGIEHLMHPEFAPGVPLRKLTPHWVPIPLFWAYLVGAILLISGIAILLNKRARFAATIVGLVMTLLTLLLYTPLLAIASGPAQITEGVNYVADTLLYAGTVLLLAMALPADNHATAASNLQ